MSTWCVGLARVVAALSVTSLAVCTLAEGAEFITVERRNGRWFFITPDGVAFRSRGVDWVSYDGFKDAKTGRSLYCESNDAKFAGNRLKWAEDTAAKLRKWGFNSLGGGASPEVASQGFCSPSYVQFGVFRKNGADYSIGPRFPNVFHPQWDSFCDKLAREECQGRVGDSSLMGWFLGNEFHWWGSGRGVWRFGLFNDAASAPDGHPAKAALLNFCGGTTNVADSVKEAFVTLCAERFFSVTCGAIRRYDPNHLILGCRFMGWEGGAISNVWQTASKYCDVISFNQYPRLTNGIICVRSEPFSDIISRLSHWVGGKPLMITEWSFLARDSGLPCSNGCGQRLQTQSERATAVAAFLNQIGDNPNIVGHNFFMWLDEPAGGLASGATGEDGNYGLVNAAGEPYRLVTEAFTAHFNSEKSKHDAATCAMERLPPGSVKPQGWLLKQLELLRDGLTGHAEELYVDIGMSDWLTGGKRGGQFAWERGPYYAKGLVALAFALDDEVLKMRAKRWIDAYITSQRENGDFGPKERNWWANMIVLWTLRDWCEATNDARVVPFLERYFAFQREAFAGGDSFVKDSPWAVARAGDELDVILWLSRKTGKVEWLDYARTVAAMSADWTDYYHNGGKGGWGDEGYRAHIVNFMQGLKTPPLKWLLGGEEADRTAFHAALSLDGWAMRKYGRPDRAVNGTETLSSRSSTQGTELCATAEHILSANVAIETLGDADIADDMEVVAYNTLPATLAQDGKGMRYYCLLNQVECSNGELCFRHNGNGFFANVSGPYSGFGCCRSNFHFAWPKFVESMWMKREGGIAATAYGDCVVRTSVAMIAETGGYPFSDGVRLEIIESVDREWPLFVRIPGWCKDANVKVNGTNTQICSPPGGSFMRLSRKWRKGDVVELSFPSKPVVTRWKDDSIAVMRGALLYALRIDDSEKVVSAAGCKNAKNDASGVLRDRDLGFPMKELRAKSPWNYALVVDGANDKPQFQVKGDGADCRLAVRAVRTSYAGWGTMRADAIARAEDPPPSPVPVDVLQGKVEVIELVPIAFTQLRITLFPWVKDANL